MKWTLCRIEPEPQPVTPPTLHTVPEAGLYIGRQWKEYKASEWRNPHRMVGDTLKWRVALVNKFRDTLLDDKMRFRLPELRGQRLVCWCPPKPCHGHMLIALCQLHTLPGAPCPTCGAPIKSILNTWHNCLAESWRCHACLAYGFVRRPLPVMTDEGIILRPIPPLAAL